MEKVTRIVTELLAAGAFLLGCAVVACNWSLLPETVPIHFGLFGQPDGFGSKGWLIAMPVLSAFMYLALSIAQRYPQFSNTPWKITAENREVQYALIRWLLQWLKLEVMVLLAFLQLSMVNVALGLATGLNMTFMIIFLVILFGTIASYMYRGYRSR